MRARRRDERGSIAPAVPIIAFVLLLLGGLGIDSSRQLNARGEAVAFAEEAARAGAQGVNLDTDALELDDNQVRSRVSRYCAALLTEGRVRTCHFVDYDKVSKDDPRKLVVVTEVTMSIKSTLLGLVGVRHLDASARARARPYEGLEDAFGPDNGKAPPPEVPDEDATPPPGPAPTAPPTAPTTPASPAAGLAKPAAG
jgi:hypothetical protein